MDKIIELMQIEELKEKYNIDDMNDMPTPAWNHDMDRFCGMQLYSNFIYPLRDGLYTKVAFKKEAIKNYSQKFEGFGEWCFSTDWFKVIEFELVDGKQYLLEI